MVFLGDVMDLTEEELREFRNKIYEAYNEFLKTESLYALVNFILWCYEYLESYASAQLQTNAKMTIIKEYFESMPEWQDYYQKVIKNLFFVRLKIVHRPFLINYTLDEDVSYSNKHKHINPLSFYNDNIKTLSKILKLAEVDIEIGNNLKEEILEIDNQENNSVIDAQQDDYQETDTQKESESKESSKAEPVNAFL